MLYEVITIIKMNISIKNKLLGIIIGLTVLTGFTGCKDGVDLQLPYLFLYFYINKKVQFLVFQMYLIFLLR